jgi:hypothetical protein
MTGTVISLCDVSGVMVQPWLDAGFECWIVDIQHPRGVTKEGRLRKVGADIHELYRGHWWLPESAYRTFSFPDCTYLTSSGNRWQRERGPGCVGRGLLFADACWRLHIAFGVPWMMENPVMGRLSSGWRKPDHAFHPWEYAGYLEDIQIDNTSKGTGLWTSDDFVMPEKKPAPEPHRSDCHEAAPGEDRADIRSVTPKGFAQAVFHANVYADVI